MPATVGRCAGYHAAAGAPRECRQEPAGQGEMAEMVGAKLAFVALRGGLALRDRHHAGVVDQQVQAPAAGQERRAESLDRREVGQVELGQLGVAGRRLGVNPFQRRRAPGAVTGGQQHVGTAAGQLQHGLIAQADVAAGDENCPARLVRNVLCGPSGHLCFRHVPILAPPRMTQNGREPGS